MNCPPDSKPPKKGRLYWSCLFFSPTRIALSVLRDETADPADRKWAAAPYVHPPLSTSKQVVRNEVSIRARIEQARERVATVEVEELKSVVIRRC